MSRKEFYYVRAGDAVWYFTSLDRRDIIQQAIVDIQRFMSTRPTQTEFDLNPEIQNILASVPECTVAYQQQLRRQTRDIRQQTVLGMRNFKI
jgi:hypothetical protein